MLEAFMENRRMSERERLDSLDIALRDKNIVDNATYLFFLQVILWDKNSACWGPSAPAIRLYFCHIKNLVPLFITIQDFKSMP